MPGCGWKESFVMASTSPWAAASSIAGRLWKGPSVYSPVGEDAREGGAQRLLRMELGEIGDARRVREVALRVI